MGVVDTIKSKYHESKAGIEELVVITAALIVLNYILDLSLHRSMNRYRQFFLNILAAVPYPLLTYTFALMQLSKSNNDIYQVWAVVLLTLHYSVRDGRPSGIFRKQNPLQDMWSSFWAANLLGTKSTLLKIPLWLLWCLNTVRLMVGFADTELTSSRHGRQLRLLTEYMRTEHKHFPLEDCDPKHMKGYKYFVWGEDQQKTDSDPPEYKVRLQLTNEKKFVTTEDVWERNGTLLGKPEEVNKVKDLCLAFAFFKLSRRWFFDLPIHEANQPKTKELVQQGLIRTSQPTNRPTGHEANQPNFDRVFKIIEAEVAFLDDFFYTRFAVIFAGGFPIVRFGLSLAVSVMTIYIASVFYHLRKRLGTDLSHTTNGVTVTYVLLCILALKEICEMVTYLLSDWTKVILTSNYVQKTCLMKYRPIAAVMKFFCKYKIRKRWHGNLSLYNLFRGRYQIALPKEVKSAVIESLEYFCNHPGALEKYMSEAKAYSLYPDFAQNIPLIEYSTETQRILVWHIATCYCEINQIMVAQGSQGTTKLARRSKSPFPIENFSSQKKDLISHYKAATGLSQYCAHLLTLQCPLVPDRNLVASELLKATVNVVRRYLRSCNSCESVLIELDKLASEKDDNVSSDKDKKDGDSDGEESGVVAHGNNNDKDNKDGGSPKRVQRCLMSHWREERERRTRSATEAGEVVLKSGVRLGSVLLKMIKTDTERWEFLEKYWAGYMLYLAASITPEKQKVSLLRREFLTHVWALLFHAGVLGKTMDCKFGQVQVESAELTTTRTTTNQAFTDS